MNNSVGVTFSLSDSAGTTDEYWIHIEQVLPEEETISLGDTAKLVDSLYGIDPCGEYSPTEETPFTEEEDYSDIPDTIYKSAVIAQERALLVQEQAKFFQDRVKEYIDLGLCLIDSNSGDYAIQLKIGRSHQNENYSLEIIEGEEIQTTTIKEVVNESYDIEEGYSIDLPSPVLADSRNEFSFENVVRGQYGYTTSPTVSLNGRTLSWEGPVTGILKVSYSTIYDIVDAVVYGDAEGEPQEATVLVFYKGMVETADISEPDIETEGTELEKEQYCETINGGTKYEPAPNTDVVTCYETVRYNYRCRCSPDTIAYFNEVNEVVTCPNQNMRCTEGLMSDAHEVDDHIECTHYMGSRTVIEDYVPCPESYYNQQTKSYGYNPEDAEISDPDYYERICCHEPDGDLPLCRSLYEKNKGQSMDAETKATYEERYGEKLRIVPLRPEDGDCGYSSVTYVTSPRNCCVGIDPLAVNEEESPTVLADDSTGIVRLLAPTVNSVTVTVTGSGFFADENRSSKTASYLGGSLSFLVYTGASCGRGTITITDGCSSVTHSIASTNGQWSEMIGDLQIGQEVGAYGLTAWLVYSYGGVERWKGTNHLYRQYETRGRTTGCGSSVCVSACYDHCGVPDVCELGTIGTHSNLPCYTMDSVFSNLEFWESNDSTCIPGKTISCHCYCVSGNSYEEWIC